MVSSTTTVLRKLLLRHPLNTLVCASGSNSTVTFHQPRRQVSKQKRFGDQDKQGDLKKVLQHFLKDKMPKEEPHLKPLMEKRKKQRKQYDNTTATKIYWQVLGSGAEGGQRALFLYTDGGKYMFNCSEGTQRTCHEYTTSRSLADLGHILITRKSWENLGGLPGMYLSIRQAGSPDVTVHGPKKTIEIYHALRPFSAQLDFDVLKWDSTDPGKTTSKGTKSCNKRY